MAECNGICVTADDLGLSEFGSGVAYPHPDCPEHGDYHDCEHCEGTGLVWDETACGDPDHCSPTYHCYHCDGSGVIRGHSQ